MPGMRLRLAGCFSWGQIAPPGRVGFDSADRFACVRIEPRASARGYLVSFKPLAFFSRATEGIRTPDPLDHNQVL